MATEKRNVQLIWGILLVLAGIGVFYRIPQVMPRIETIEYFKSGSIIVRVSFYIVGLILICGGGQKIFRYISNRDNQ